MIVQLDIFDALDAAVAGPPPAGPAVRLLRATVRGLVGDCTAAGIDPRDVLGGLRSVLWRAQEADDRGQYRRTGQAVVRTWEAEVRSRMGRARLQLKDDVERGRVALGSREPRVADRSVPGSRTVEAPDPGSRSYRRAAA